MRLRLLFITLALSTDLASNAAWSGTPSFHCAKASGWVETTICADDGLAALDLELAEVFARMLRAQDPARRARVEKTQRQWWATRAACEAHAKPVDCLDSRYRERIAALKADPDYPGDVPVSAPVLTVQESSVRQAGPGWTRQLSEYARAITRCRAEARVPVARVITAWKEDGGESVAMWLRLEDERRVLCRTGRRGDTTAQWREQSQGEVLPQTEAVLDPRASRPPAQCAPVPILDKDGRSFGWLLKPNC